MQISATDYTLAAIFDPSDARELRDVLLGHPLTVKNSPALTEFYDALERFVDGDDYVGEEEDDGT